MPLDNIEVWDSLVPSVLAVAVLDSSLTYLPVVVDPSWNVNEYKKGVPPQAMTVKQTNEVKKWEQYKHYVFIPTHWTDLNY